MSDCGGVIRQHTAMKAALQETTEQMREMETVVGVGEPAHLEYAYQLQDLLLTQQAVLTAMLDFGKVIGYTRGSALYCSVHGKLRSGLEEIFRFYPRVDIASNQIQEVCFTENAWTVRWRPVRPIPQDEAFFENVWRQYQKKRNIF